MTIKKFMRQPGVEPGTAAWKATMLTVTPSTLVDNIQVFYIFLFLKSKNNSYFQKTEAAF